MTVCMYVGLCMYVCLYVSGLLIYLLTQFTYVQP